MTTPPPSDRTPDSANNAAGKVAPCPFCGHVGLDFNEEGSTFRWAYADCAGCGASTGEVRKHADWRQDAIAAWNTRAAAPTSEPPISARATHRHIKSGGLYTELARGKLQTSEPLDDMQDMVAYRGEDGRVWFRPLSEFGDVTRFEPLTKLQRPSREWYAAKIAETLDDDFIIGPASPSTPGVDAAKPCTLYRYLSTDRGYVVFRNILDGKAELNAEHHREAVFVHEEAASWYCDQRNRMTVENGSDALPIPGAAGDGTAKGGA
jgi:Lar family restriction alleviation protein